MCPYCGSSVYVGVTTNRRSDGQLIDPEDLSSERIEQTWENECKICGKWSLHFDINDSQVALVDPFDSTSAII